MLMIAPGTLAGNHNPQDGRDGVCDGNAGHGDDQNGNENANQNDGDCDGSSEGDTQVAVANADPSIEGVVVNDNDAVIPVPGDDVSVPFEISAADGNGVEDLHTIAWTITDVDGNVVASGTVTVGTDEACSVADGVMTCDLSFDLEYWRPPTTDTEKYTLDIDVTDDSGTTISSSTPWTFDVQEAVGIDIEAASIDFGTLSPGSESSIEDLVVKNHGNVALDVEVDATDLDHETRDATIAKDRLSVSLADDMTGAQTMETARTLDTFDLAPGEGASKATHWQLDVPSGSEQYIPSGTYRGTVTITAMASS